LRAHGLTNFPDPQISSSGGASLNLNGTHIDPTSPTVQHAIAACQPDLAKDGSTSANNP
jgi:hypothetical protein